jgi:hypothetical protein
MYIDVFQYVTKLVHNPAHTFYPVYQDIIRSGRLKSVYSILESKMTLCVGVGFIEVGIVFTLRSPDILGTHLCMAAGG